MRRSSLQNCLLLFLLSLALGQLDQAEETTTDPERTAATFGAMEECTAKCECGCTHTIVMMEDGRELRMFHCVRPKVVQGRSAIAVILDSPFLLALVSIVLISLVVFLVVSGVFGCCMCCKKQRAKNDHSVKLERGRFDTNSAAGDSLLVQPKMLSLFLFSLLVGSLASPDVLNKDVIESIEKEMSREVEEEFSGKEHQDELEILKKQFAAAHTGNETFIRIPTELDINSNKTDLFEGDIDLSPDQWKVALDFDPTNPMRRRQALSSVTSMWQPIGAPVIPYTFQPGFPAQYQQVVRDAIAFWEQRTCAKFRLATPSDTSAIVFNHNANGCSSAVGRRNGRQQLNLQIPGCMTVTIVAHELSHAFGTLHVQSRVDRDTYVQIDTANIQRGMEHNFKMEPNGYSTYGLPYEFGSMQHYFPHAFAVNQQRPTIYARPAYQRFQGSMDGPRATFWDTVLINKMYKCSDKCPRQMACQNNGVTDGANCNKCFCPRGWTGTNCERRPSDAQIVNVAATAQNVKIEMTGGFNGFQEKLVVLQAPAGRRIEATVKSFGPYRFDMCRSVGLEVIPTTDTRTSGLRFCTQPNQSTPIVSDGNTMLLWLYRDANYPVNADVSVRAV